MRMFTTAISALAAAVTALLATTVTAVPLTGTTSLPGNARLSRQLLQKAVRVNRAGQRILDGESVELTSAHSIQFDTCVSLKTEPSDNAQFIFNENLATYTTNGDLVVEQSYILFSVCKTIYCDYYAKGDNLYMIDLATYMDTVAEFYAEREEAYCAACMDSYNYCKYVEYQKQSNKYYNEMTGANQYYEDLAEEEEVAEEAAAAEYQQGGGRRRRHLNRNNFELVDCDVCTKMNCFYSETVAEVDAQAEGTTATAVPDTESITTWVNEIAQCQATESLFLDYYAMYAGFMCNEDGSGVDIALFLDEDCTIYNSNTGYKSVASDENQAIMYAATDMITYPFLHRINCNGQYTYLSMDEYREMVQTYGGYNNQQNNEESEISSYCEAIYTGGDSGSAIALSDCDSDGEQDEREEGDTEVTMYYDEAYGYAYSLSTEASQDTESVCKVIRNMQGEYETVYRWAGSGQIYNYGTGPTKKTFYDEYLRAHPMDQMGAPLIAAIVAAVAVALTAFGCILYSCFSPNSAPNKFAEQRNHRKELDNKRERLVEDSGPDNGLLM